MFQKKVPRVCLCTISYKRKELFNILVVGGFVVVFATALGGESVRRRDDSSSLVPWHAEDGDSGESTVDVQRIHPICPTTLQRACFRQSDLCTLETNVPDPPLPPTVGILVRQGRPPLRRSSLEF